MSYDRSEAKYIGVQITLAKHEVMVYASPRVAESLKLINSLDLYHGVKILKLVEAVYKQGHKDGARETLNQLGDKITQLQENIKHRNPGRPIKK